MPRAICECVYKEPQLGGQGFCSLGNDNAGPFFESLSRKFAHKDDIFINSNLDISIFVRLSFILFAIGNFYILLCRAKLEFLCF